MIGTKTVHYKLVILGDTATGKSCLVVRFAKGVFHEAQEPTIGAAFMTQAVKLEECTVKFEIWDTAGQERYKSLAPMYYRGSAVAVIVFDITSPTSFESAKQWVDELESTDTMVALAGNKVDLDSQRTVSTKTAQDFADSKGILYMETSAKEGTNVDEFFKKIATNLPKESDVASVAKGFKVVSQGDEKPPEEGFGCCN
mmetsp:Transcript_60485/g.129769  ORF Transcript_60485/g.129769 Transcript_60485/m.129769 type:complete len:199 (+) Transcript_60485:76-672(+)